MSVVVVLKDNDKYIIGCDTRISSQDEYIDSYKQSKKARHLDMNKELIIAGVRKYRTTRYLPASNR